ncbi:MAG: TonB-dependent siderophore receptor [Alphaproteobacteria bacterium]
MTGISKKPVPRVETLQWGMAASVSVMALVAALSFGMTEARAEASGEAGQGVRQVAKQIAQAPRTYALTIPAKPLLSALADFTAATGVQVVQPNAQGLSGNSAAISGTFTPAEALGRMLAGTGYGHRMTDPTTAVLERIQANGGSMELDPIMVQGRSGAAGGGTAYVPRRSVSAGKSDTPIVETPQSVSVVPRAQIEDQGSKTVMQSLRYTPGAFTGQVGASNRYDYVILRGFVDRSIDNVYLDGLKLMGDDSTYSSMQIDPYFLERIEAVKGPSSVLYGRSSPGGLIALTSKKPTFDPFAQVEATVGTSDQRSIGVDVGGPLGDGGKAAYRITGIAKGADTQFGDTREERYAIAPSLTARFTEDTTLTLMSYFQHDPEGGTHNGVPADGALYAHNGRKISRGFFDGEPSREGFDRTQAMLGYQIDHRIDDVWAVRQNLRYLSSQVKIDQVYQIGWVGNTDRLSRFYGGGHENLQALTIDNQVQADFSTGPVTHTVLAGLDYQQRRTRNDWTFGAATSIDAYEPVYGYDAVTGAYAMKATRGLRQTGLYLQDQVALGGWRLSAGLRQDWLHSFVHNRLTDVEKGEGRAKLTGRAGLLYLFDNGIAPYVSYSTSFSPSLYTGADGSPLAPTEGRQYEAGVKYQPPGSRSLITAALFDIEQKNVAVADPNTFIYHPVGTIRSRGLELEGRLQLTESLKLLAGYSHTDVIYKSSPNGKRGNTPPQIPRHMASLWAEYSVLGGALNGLSIGAGARYVGQSWADSANTTRVPSYTVADLSLRYDMEALGLRGTEVRVNANNLFDRSYVASCLELSNCYFGERRNVTATLSHKF